MKTMVKRSGFTLIEIIIVVAILGILAIGLIAALNPVEQINRAHDTTTLSLAREFTNSASRFQTNKIHSPACPNVTCSAYVDSLSSTASVPLSSLTTVNVAMYAEGATDGPTSFTGEPDAADMYVSVSSVTQPQDTSMVICWRPRSKIVRSEADVNNMHSTIYSDIGTVQSASACPADGSNSCYRCMRQ